MRSQAVSGRSRPVVPNPTSSRRFIEGRLELSAAGTASGAAIVGTFTGSYGDEPQ